MICNFGQVKCGNNEKKPQLLIACNFVLLMRSVNTQHAQTHYIIAFFMQIAITQIVIVVKYLICFPLRTNMSCWMIHANTKTKHTQIEREKKLKKQTKEWKERKWTTKCKKNTLGRQEWRRKNRRISWKFFIRNKNVILVYNV